METIIYKDRINTDCEKWDGLKAKFGQDDLLPLWVADMDFQTAKCIQEGLKNYIDQGTYGYYINHSSYLEAFINWQKENHKVTLEKEWIRYAPSVVTAINWCIQIITEVSDSVMVLIPVYYPFFNAINNNNRNLVVSELLYDEGIYKINFYDFE